MGCKMTLNELKIYIKGKQFIFLAEMKTEKRTKLLKIR